MWYALLIIFVIGGIKLWLYRSAQNEKSARVLLKSFPQRYQKVYERMMHFGFGKDPMLSQHLLNACNALLNTKYFLNSGSNGKAAFQARQMHIHVTEAEERVESLYMALNRD